MSSDHPSGGPSATPEEGAGDSLPAPAGGEQPDRAAVVATLGAALVDALEAHLPGARQHAEATAAYAFAAAAQLNLGRERSGLVRETAKLHDVGMVYVPVAVLRKPHAELTAEDRELLASQIESGSRLAVGAGIPADVCEWILHTRERWAGGGPAGLSGHDIPVESRIVRVACAADLMLASAGVEATATGLRGAAGSELDPGVVAVVAEALGRIS